MAVLPFLFCDMDIKLHFAPLQGHTTATYRRAHYKIWGGIACYYTPFVRIEKGTFRNKDLADIAPAANESTPVVPQMLPRNAEELRRLTELFLEYGYRQADINMGCPFPPIALHRRGAGILPYPEAVAELLHATTEYPEMEFSVKMRLGWEHPDEWMPLISLLNSARLHHIALHPRIGKAQYKGCIRHDSFESFYEQCRQPLIYNGDLLTTTDIRQTAERYPRLAGIMVGHGLLARPYLPALCAENASCSLRNIMSKTETFHDTIYEELKLASQGDAQLMLRAHAIWEYFLPHTPRRERKRIMKSSSPRQYKAAVKELFKAWQEMPESEIL